MLADFCAVDDVDTILLFHESSIFPDCDLSLTLLRGHNQASADASFAPLCPPGLAAQIYEATAIRRLWSLGLPPTVSGDIISIMQHSNQLAAEDERLRFHIHVPSPGAMPDLPRLPSSLLIQDRLTFEAASGLLTRGQFNFGSQDAYRFKEALVELCRATPAPLVEKRSTSQRAAPILFVSRYAGYSGAEESFSLLINYLSKTEFAPSVVLPGEGALSDRLRAAGIPVALADEEFAKLTPRTIRCWERTLATGDFRIVHTNGNAGLALAVAANHLNIPVVHHVRVFHGLNAPDILRFSAKNIAISNAVAEDLLRSGIDPTSIVRIYNGVELARFHDLHIRRTSMRGDLGLTENNVICMVARIAEQKRQEQLLRALPLILADHPRATAIFVGEVVAPELPYYEKLQRLVKEYSLQNHVKFWGFEPNIEKIYSVADVVTLCTANEPFGRCLLEAAAAGVPIVAPASGGPREFLSHGTNCLLYDPSDPRQLADAICRVLSEAGLGASLIKEGLATAQGLTIEHHVDKVSALYRTLLATPGADVIRQRTSELEICCES